MSFERRNDTSIPHPIPYPSSPPSCLSLRLLLRSSILHPLPQYILRTSTHHEIQLLPRLFLPHIQRRHSKSLAELRTLTYSSDYLVVAVIVSFDLEVVVVGASDSLAVCFDAEGLGRGHGCEESWIWRVWGVMGDRGWTLRAWEFMIDGGWMVLGCVLMYRCLLCHRMRGQCLFF
jgi:hypothetical protein